MIRESDKDLEKKVLNFFNPVLKTLQAEDFMIAGGSVLAVYQALKEESSLDNIHIKDVDLFLKSADAFHSIKNIFLKLKRINSGSSANGMHRGDNSTTIYTNFIDIDLITRKYYPNIDEVFAEFDLDICCIGINVDRHLVYTDQFIQAFEDKTFSINDQPVDRVAFDSTLKRIAKYIHKGYDFEQESLVDFIESAVDDDIVITPPKGSSLDDGEVVRSCFEMKGIK